MPVDRTSRLAFDATKEIVIASCQQSQMTKNKANGECVAEFFEEIYKKLSVLAKDVHE